MIVDGQILARGGGTHGSGGGSGGAIRILAPVFAGSGRLSVEGGRSIGIFVSQRGGSGRIRIEARDHDFTGQIVGESRSASLSPQARFLPESSWPSVRVTSVAGAAVSPTPTGGFDVPDVAIDTVDQTTPLTGTDATSTATATATFPPGFSRVFVQATW